MEEEAELAAATRCAGAQAGPLAWQGALQSWGCATAQRPTCLGLPVGTWPGGRTPAKALGWLVL
jgi:hypothetical protein